MQLGFPTIRIASDLPALTSAQYFPDCLQGDSSFRALLSNVSSISIWMMSLDQDNMANPQIHEMLQYHHALELKVIES